MRSSRSQILALLAACALAACGQTSAQAPAGAPAEAQTTATNSALPVNVGDCVQTAITETGPRLEGVDDSGSGVVYANGASQVSYDVVPAIRQSHAGDAVELCLVSIPENCPPGDNRGRVYAAKNARTGESWTLPDSQHMCGGA